MYQAARATGVDALGHTGAPTLYPSGTNPLRHLRYVLRVSIMLWSTSVIIGHAHAGEPRENAAFRFCLTCAHHVGRGGASNTSFPRQTSATRMLLPLAPYFSFYVSMLCSYPHCATLLCYAPKRQTSVMDMPLTLASYPAQYLYVL